MQSQNSARHSCTSFTKFDFYSAWEEAEQNVVAEIQQDRQLPKPKFFMLVLQSEVKMLLSHLPEVAVRIFVS